LSYTEAIFVVSHDGIERIDRGVSSYDFPILELGVTLALPGAKRVEVKTSASDYRYDRIVCYVRPGGRANFLRVCRILNRVPENCVYAVSTCDVLQSLHRTRQGADFARETLVLQGEIVDPQISLEEIEE